MTMMKPELLSPAGSMDSLRAAVNSGCDAVYLGGKQFSARAYAGNFDLQEGKYYIRKCRHNTRKNYFLNFFIFHNVLHF